MGLQNFIMEEDGVGVVEVILILVVLITLVLLFKERIMDVALHMFAERGYEAVSIRDICGVVGIRESTLYYHYKNKQDILDSLVVRFEKHIAE